MELISKFKGLFHNIFKNPIKAAELPHGIKLILWYTAILSVFQFLIGFSMSFLYPKMLSFNPMLILFNIISVFVCAVIIAGIIKRKYWAYKLTIIWYFTIICYNFLYFFFTYDLFDVMSQVLLIGLVFSFIVNCVVIWYLFSQKEYFKHKGIFFLHKRLKLKLIEANDHIFLVVFTSFWFVTLIVLAFAGYQILSETFSITDDVLKKAENSGNYDSSLCEKEYLQNGQKKDVCFMTFGIMKKQIQYCSLVESPFYKFTCFMGASNGQ